MNAFSKTKGVKPNRQAALAEALDFIHRHLRINDYQLRTQHGLDPHILLDIKERTCSIYSFDTYVAFTIRLLYKHRSLHIGSKEEYKKIDDFIKHFFESLFDLPDDKIRKYSL